MILCTATDQFASLKAIFCDEKDVQETKKYCALFAKTLDDVFSQPTALAEFEDRLAFLHISMFHLHTTVPLMTYCLDIYDLCHTLFMYGAQAVLSIDWFNLSDSSEAVQLFLQSAQALHEVVEEKFGVQWFLVLQHLSQSAWSYPVLLQILKSDVSMDPDLVKSYLTHQIPGVVEMRINLLFASGCYGMTLNLCDQCLRHRKYKDSDYIRLVQVICLHENKQLDRLYEECWKVHCDQAVRLIQTMIQQRRPGYRALCTRLSLIFLMQDWLKPNKYCCTKTLLMLWLRLQLDEDSAKCGDVFVHNVRTVAEQARNGTQIVWLIDALCKLFGEYSDMLSRTCALTSFNISPSVNRYFKLQELYGSGDGYESTSSDDTIILCASDYITSCPRTSGEITTKPIGMRGKVKKYRSAAAVAMEARLLGEREGDLAGGGDGDGAVDGGSNGVEGGESDDAASDGYVLHNSFSCMSFNDEAGDNSAMNDGVKHTCSMRNLHSVTLGESAQRYFGTSAESSSLVQRSDAIEDEQTKEDLLKSDDAPGLFDFYSQVLKNTSTTEGDTGRGEPPRIDAMLDECKMGDTSTHTSKFDIAPVEGLVVGDNGGECAVSLSELNFNNNSSVRVVATPDMPMLSPRSMQSGSKDSSPSSGSSITPLLSPKAVLASCLPSPSISLALSEVNKGSDVKCAKVGSASTGIHQQSPSSGACVKQSAMAKLSTKTATGNSSCIEDLAVDKQVREVNVEHSVTNQQPSEIADSVELSVANQEPKDIDGAGDMSVEHLASKLLKAQQNVSSEVSMECSPTRRRSPEPNSDTLCTELSVTNHNYDASETCKEVIHSPPQDHKGEMCISNDSLEVTDTSQHLLSDSGHSSVSDHLLFSPSDLDSSVFKTDLERTKAVEYLNNILQSFPDLELHTFLAMKSYKDWMKYHTESRKVPADSSLCGSSDTDCPAKDICASSAAPMSNSSLYESTSKIRHNSVQATTPQQEKMEDSEADTLDECCDKGAKSIVQAILDDIISKCVASAETQGLAEVIHRLLSTGALTKAQLSQTIDTCAVSPSGGWSELATDGIVSGGTGLGSKEERMGESPSCQPSSPRDVELNEIMQESSMLGSVGGEHQTDSSEHREVIPTTSTTAFGAVTGQDCVEFTSGDMQDTDVAKSANADTSSFVTSLNAVIEDLVNLISRWNDSSFGINSNWPELQQHCLEHLKLHKILYDHEKRLLVDMRGVGPLVRVEQLVLPESEPSSYSDSEGYDSDVFSSEGATQSCEEEEGADPRGTVTEEGSTTTAASAGELLSRGTTDQTSSLKMNVENKLQGSLTALVFLMRSDGAPSNHGSMTSKWLTGGELALPVREGTLQFTVRGASLDQLSAAFQAIADDLKSKAGRESGERKLAFNVDGKKHHEEEKISRRASSDLSSTDSEPDMPVIKSYKLSDLAKVRKRGMSEPPGSYNNDRIRRKRHRRHRMSSHEGKRAKVTSDTEECSRTETLNTTKEMCQGVDSSQIVSALSESSRVDGEPGRSEGGTEMTVKDDKSDVARSSAKLPWKPSVQMSPPSDLNLFEKSQYKYKRYRSAAKTYRLKLKEKAKATLLKNKGDKSLGKDASEDRVYVSPFQYFKSLHFDILKKKKGSPMPRSAMVADATRNWATMDKGQKEVLRRRWLEMSRSWLVTHPSDPRAPQIQSAVLVEAPSDQSSYAAHGKGVNPGNSAPAGVSSDRQVLDFLDDVPLATLSNMIVPKSSSQIDSADDTSEGKPPSDLTKGQPPVETGDSVKPSTIPTRQGLFDILKPISDVTGDNTGPAKEQSVKISEAGFVEQLKTVVNKTMMNNASSGKNSSAQLETHSNQLVTNGVSKVNQSSSSAHLEGDHSKVSGAEAPPRRKRGRPPKPKDPSQLVAKVRRSRSKVPEKKRRISNKQVPLSVSNGNTPNVQATNGSSTPPGGHQQTSSDTSLAVKNKVVNSKVIGNDGKHSIKKRSVQGDIQKRKRKTDNDVKLSVRKSSDKRDSEKWKRKMSKTVKKVGSTSESWKAKILSRLSTDDTFSQSKRNTISQDKRRTQSLASENLSLSDESGAALCVPSGKEVTEPLPASTAGGNPAPINRPPERRLYGSGDKRAREKQYCLTRDKYLQTVKPGTEPMESQSKHDSTDPIRTLFQYGMTKGRQSDSEVLTVKKDKSVNTYSKISCSGCSKLFFPVKYKEHVNECKGSHSFPPKDGTDAHSSKKSVEVPVPKLTSESCRTRQPEWLLKAEKSSSPVVCLDDSEDDIPVVSSHFRAISDSDDDSSNHKVIKHCSVRLADLDSETEINQSPQKSRKASSSSEKSFGETSKEFLKPRDAYECAFLSFCHNTSKPKPVEQPLPRGRRKYNPLLEVSRGKSGVSLESGGQQTLVTEADASVKQLFQAGLRVRDGRKVSLVEADGVKAKVENGNLDQSSKADRQSYYSAFMDFTIATAEQLTSGSLECGKNTSLMKTAEKASPSKKMSQESRTARELKRLSAAEISTLTNSVQTRNNLRCSRCGIKCASPRTLTSHRARCSSRRDVH